MRLEWEARLGVPRRLFHKCFNKFDCRELKLLAHPSCPPALLPGPSLTLSASFAQLFTDLDKVWDKCLGFVTQSVWGRGWRATENRNRA